MSPLHIKIVLHAYSTTDPWPYNGSPAEHAYINELIADGLIVPRDAARPHDYGHYLTDRGDAYVHGLMRMPLPQYAVPTLRDVK